MTTAPSTAPISSRFTITRRGRVVLTALAALPLVIGALFVALNGGVATASDTGSAGTSFEYVTIHAGESLWQLAESIAPNSDPRDVIAEIVSLNRLSTDAVEPGQRLAIPADY